MDSDDDLTDGSLSDDTLPAAPSDDDDDDISRYSDENWYDAPVRESVVTHGPQVQLEEFDDYKRISFRSTKHNTEGSKDAIVTLMQFSPRYLSPDEDTGLYEKMNMQEGEAPTNVTREEYGKDRMNILLLECYNGAKAGYQEKPLFTRPVLSTVQKFNGTNLPFDPNIAPSLQLGSVTFTVASTDVRRIKAKLNKSLALLHLARSNGGPSDFSLKFKGDHLNETTALVYIRNLSASTTPQGTNLALWPTKKGDIPGVWDDVQTFAANLQYVVTEQNLPVLQSFNVPEPDENEPDKLDSKKRVKKAPLLCLTLIDKINMFSRQMRMVTIPNYPDYHGPEHDYNLSRLYDAIVSPSRFPVTATYRPEQNINEKLVELVSREGINALMIKGGPGTGKTTQTCGAIINRFNVDKGGRKLYIDGKEAGNYKVLYIAPSNAAADVAYRKLCEAAATCTTRDLRIRRVGERSKFAADVQEMRIDSIYRHKDERENLRRNHAVQVSLMPEREKRYDVNVTANFDAKTYITEADIIVSTAGSCQCNELVQHRQKLGITVLVIDEAGQGNEIELLLPLCYTSLKYLVMVGDTAQLGPTILTTQLLRKPIDFTSIFVRLVKQLKEIDPLYVHALTEQGRMRPLLCEIVSELAYSENPLKSMPTAGEATRAEFNFPPFILFSGPSWAAVRGQNSKSYKNEKEARFGMALLKALRSQRGGKNLTYAIICFYNEQVDTYRAKLLEAGYGPDDNVRVTSVDAMQGSQVHVAIISAVRADSNMGVGFAASLNRLNVAMSRAGCSYVLAHHPSFSTQKGWSKLFKFATKRKLYYGDADDLMARNAIGLALNAASNDRANQA